MSKTTLDIDIGDIAPKLAPLFDDKNPRFRYYIIHGGRFSTKSHTVAKRFIMLALTRKCRILCTREIQKTIKDSVHRLLWDMIIQTDTVKYFEKTDNEIRCILTGSFFSFRGLKTNVEGVKSAEGYDYLWIEEGDKVSANSFDNVIPTIRKDGSEIYIVYNDSSTFDEVHIRFVERKRKDACVIKINYTDIPRRWIPAGIWEDIEHDRETRPKHYKRIWLGTISSGGKFFAEFGEHLREKPFNIQPHECNLYGSLDYGDGEAEGAGATSFGLWHLGKDRIPRRLFTYYKRHQNAATYAREIIASCKSFHYTQGVMPKIVFADPSMFIKRRMDDNYSKSVADIFEEHGMKLAMANNSRVNGWRVMRDYFSVDKTGRPKSTYWDGFNDEYEAYLPTIKEKETNPDDCEKGGEDHIADDTRYFLVAAMGLAHTPPDALSKKKRQQAAKLNVQVSLATRNIVSSETGY